MTLVLRGNLLGRRDSPLDRERTVHDATSSLADELHFTWLSRYLSAPLLGDTYLRTRDRFHGDTNRHR